jgi:hypothetical protein
MRNAGIWIGAGAAVMAFALGAGCGTSTDDGAISCGYYVERAGYELTNVQFGDFESDVTWATGLPLSRHLRRPAPDNRFDWLPLSQPTLLNIGGSGTGGLGRVSSDARCQETLYLFDSIEALDNDPDGFTYVEQQAELRFAAVDFTFPATLAQAEAAPATQDTTVQAIADLTRDKTRVVSGAVVRRQIAKQTITFSMSCDTAAQVTTRWAPRIERDDPEFCRAAGGETECVQFNLAFAAEHCTLTSDAAVLRLPSGMTTVDLGGDLTRLGAGSYQLRIDDIRLLR